MKKIRILLLVFLSLTFFSGCIQVNTKVNLNNDGSGTIEETFLMKSSFVKMIKDFALSFDSTKKDEFKMFNEDELKDKAANYGEGVTYKSGEKFSSKDYEGYKVTYAFSDINKLRINLSPEDKVPLGGEVEKNEDESSENSLKFNFTKGNPSTLVINLPIPEAQNEDTSSSIEDSSATEDSTGSSDQLQNVINMFDGMKLSLSLNINEKIKETDATYVNGSDITLMEIDFSELIKNKQVVEDLNKSKPESLEKFKEIIGDIPGIKIETKEKVLIKF
jgi:hypothetical protein